MCVRRVPIYVHMNGSVMVPFVTDAEIDEDGLADLGSRVLRRDQYSFTRDGASLAVHDRMKREWAKRC